MTAIVACAIAWGGLFKVDFMYPLFHDIGGIAQGIEKYGPLNRYKTGFGETTRQQRVALFHAINEAVHSGGDGLADIRYQTPGSGGSQQLLREPEIVHLQDVAALINLLAVFVAAVAVAWLLLLVFAALHKHALPPLRAQCIGLGAFFVAGLALVLALGPERVFNTLHIWVFPDDHQWFFYYQESLMSTLMLAPTLFGWIAAAWALLTLLIFVGLTLVVEWVWRYAFPEVSVKKA